MICIVLHYAAPLSTMQATWKEKNDERCSSFYWATSVTSGVRAFRYLLSHQNHSITLSRQSKGPWRGWQVWPCTDCLMFCSALTISRPLRGFQNQHDQHVSCSWLISRKLAVDTCLSSCQATNFVLPLPHVSPCHFDRADCSLHLANSGVDFSLDHLFGSKHVATLAVINHES